MLSLGDFQQKTWNLWKKKKKKNIARRASKLALHLQKWEQLKFHELLSPGNYSLVFIIYAFFFYHYYYSVAPMLGILRRL